MNTSGLIANLGQDVGFGLRTLNKARVFSVSAVLIIALGIASNTAMFSVIRAVLLRPLSYSDPDRIVIMSGGATPIRYDEIRAASRSYSAIGAYSSAEDLSLSGIGEPEMLKGARVSANFLEILGVRPIEGRGFVAEEDEPGAPAVAMISAELWRRRFNADPSIVGKSVNLGGIPHLIVGVLPAGFDFPFARADAWITKPKEWSGIAPQYRPLSPTLSIFARLKQKIDIREATAELAVIDRRYAASHPGMLDAKPESPYVVRPLKEDVVSDIQPKLWLLFGAVTLVLLIVCANIGSLMLARARSRAREFAVRAAIGASRERIIRQLLAESVLLASIGGLFGIGLAAMSLHTIRGVTFIDLPRAGEIRMDGTVLAFGLVLSMLTGIVFGLIPALIASRPDLAIVLKGSGEAATAAGSKRIPRFGARGVLVVGQVALSMILLTGAALLIESLAHLYRIDPGFQPSGLLTMKIALPTNRYDSDQKRAMFYDQLLKRVESQPGVAGATVMLTLPMGDGWMGTTLDLPAREPRQLNERPIAIFENITPGYFRTMKIPLERGRDFNGGDSLGSAPVAIISESAVRLFLPQYPAGPDPIGQPILFGSDSRPLEIVGIAADVHQTGKDSDPRPGVYVPCLQKPPASAMLAVRTLSDPLTMSGLVRNQVLAMDRDQPVSEVATMDDVVDASEGDVRLMMRLLGTFAGAATLLALIGLYGVISYSVMQRTGEIGIRRALGAPTGSIISLVARQVFTLAAAGILLGIGGAFALTRLLQDMLFQVRATDPATFIGVPIVFLVVALGASYIPTRRAARIDPLAAFKIG